ncbi:tetratricopeptide repeat protein [Chloroflexota bacterium]
MDTKASDVLKAITSYIPRFVVDERILHPDTPDIHGQFRYGTLVFADISGFTAMSEKLSVLGKEGSEELTSVLNSYFAHMLDIAFSYDGNLLKFGGDAMLLLFLGNQHAAHGTRCALRMQQEMKNFSKVSTSQGVFTLRMSIGINTGDLYTANLGSPGDRLYLAFTGSTVNDVAKIESAAEAGEVLIGNKTLDELADKVDTIEMPSGYHLVTRLRAGVKSIEALKHGFETNVSEAVFKNLASYLPRQILESVKTNPERTGIEGEHRRVTVMFVNVIRSNKDLQKYERGQEEGITKTLNNYFQIVHDTADKYGGMLVGIDLNTEGHKLLIVFGTPIAHEDDDERSVLCALDMQQQVASSGLPFVQRIGINTGYVFSGELGYPARKEYTVMGDEVNLTARIMGVAEEGQVLVSASTYLKVANKFDFKKLNPVKVKGKEQPVTIYQVHRTREDTGSRRQHKTEEMVGRDIEIASVNQVAEQGLSSNGQILSITGAAGIGKTSLRQELESIWKQRGGLVYATDCLSYGSDAPYLPWINLLNSFFEIKERDDHEKRKKAIEDKMINLNPELADWTAIVGNLLSVYIEESDLVKSLSPELRHQRLLNVILDIVQSQSKKAPLLLVFDDLHWGDISSVALINYLAGNITNHPLIICVTYRRDEGFAPDFTEQVNHTEIALEDLSHESVLDIVKSIVNAEELPDQLCQLVTAKVQGNPLYTEEIVQSLIDSEYLKLDSDTGQYRLVGNLEQVDIPDTIQGVIMARLDRLEEETRNIVRVASVLGRLFNYDVLMDIYPRNVVADEMTNRLNSLVDLGLVALGKVDPWPEYSFKNTLTQEVSYESLPFAQRRQLHHKVGEYFESRYGSRIEEHYELLYYHYGRTKDHWKGLEYSVKAGDKAKRMFANEEAIRYSQRALQLAGELPHSAESVASRVQENLGDIYELTGQYDKSLDYYQMSQQWYERMRVGAKKRQTEHLVCFSDVCPNLQSPEDRKNQIALLCQKRGIVYERIGEYVEAIDLLDKGLKMATNNGEEMARLCIAKAGVLYRKSEYPEALKWCQRGLDVATSVSNHYEIAHGNYLLGNINTKLGNVNEAIKFRKQSLKLYNKIGDLPGQSRVHNNLGVDYYYLGHWNKSKEHYQKSLEIREKIGDVNGVATVANNLGEIFLDQGYFDQAIDSFSTCLSTWEKIGYSLGVGLSYSNLGKVYYKRQEWQKSLDHLQKGLQILEQLHSLGFMAEAYQRMAEVYLGLGDNESALKWCQKSHKLAQEQNMTAIEGVTRRVLGLIHSRLGDDKIADEMLGKSIEILQSVGMPYELALTFWQMAIFYDDLEQRGYGKQPSKKKTRLLEKAMAIFEKLSAEYDREKVESLYNQFLKS